MIYTIGHSNHHLETFIGLLKQHSIAAVGDVRSAPYSRYNPQFNREIFAESLKKVGITYIFLGDELGARPPEDQACYTNGQVDFALMVKNDNFKHGIEQAIIYAKQYTITLMCAEKEPLDCHRTILVCRNLKASGVHIRHILADGTIEEHNQTERRLMKLTGCERGLFTEEADILEQAYDKRSREIAYKL